MFAGKHAPRPTALQPAPALEGWKDRVRLGKKQHHRHGDHDDSSDDSDSEESESDSDTDSSNDSDLSDDEEERNIATSRQIPREWNSALKHEWGIDYNKMVPPLPIYATTKGTKEWREVVHRSIGLYDAGGPEKQEEESVLMYYRRASFAMKARKAAPAPTAVVPSRYFRKNSLGQAGSPQNTAGLASEGSQASMASSPRQRQSKGRKFSVLSQAASKALVAAQAALNRRISSQPERRNSTASVVQSQQHSASASEQQASTPAEPQQPRAMPMALRGAGSMPSISDTEASTGAGDDADNFWRDLDIDSTWDEWERSVAAEEFMRTTAIAPATTTADGKSFRSAEEYRREKARQWVRTQAARTHRRIIRKHQKLLTVRMH